MKPTTTLAEAVYPNFARYLKWIMRALIVSAAIDVVYLIENVLRYSGL